MRKKGNKESWGGEVIEGGMDRDRKGGRGRKREVLRKRSTGVMGASIFVWGKEDSPWLCSFHGSNEYLAI